MYSRKRNVLGVRRRRSYGRYHPYKRKSAWAYQVYPKVPRLQVPRSRTPLTLMDQPFRKICPLKYVKHVYTTSIPALTLQETIFRANSIYDPEYATGGHKPHGTDELMGMYKRYTVLGCRIDVEAISNLDTVTQVWGVYALMEPNELHNEFTSTGGGCNAVAEHPRMSATLLSGPSLQTVGNRRSVSMYMDIAKFFGLTRAALLANPELSAIENANPTKQCYFSLAGYEPLGNDAPTAAVFKVTLTYYVYFSEPLFIPHS